MENLSRKIEFGASNYVVDNNGFLINPETWDENFAIGLAPELSISGGLTNKHWRIIWFIRNIYNDSKSCPNIFTTCRHIGIKLKDLKELFPSGYHRGACKLAGISYKEGYINHYYWDNIKKPDAEPKENIKIYRVDANGFLVFPQDWDVTFASKKALELKMNIPLNKQQWEIINFIRDNYEKNSEIPNIYTTCDKFYLDLNDMEKLFPDGYHRGAVKLAGLRIQ